MLPFFFAKFLCFLQLQDKNNVTIRTQPVIIAFAILAAESALQSQGSAFAESSRLKEALAIGAIGGLLWCDSVFHGVILVFFLLSFHEILLLSLFETSKASHLNSSIEHLTRSVRGIKQQTQNSSINCNHPPPKKKQRFSRLLKLGPWPSSMPSSEASSPSCSISSLQVEELKISIPTKQPWETIRATPARQ